MACPSPAHIPTVSAGQLFSDAGIIRFIPIPNRYKPDPVYLIPAQQPSCEAFFEKNCNIDSRYPPSVTLRDRGVGSKPTPTARNAAECPYAPHRLCSGSEPQLPPDSTTPPPHTARLEQRTVATSHSLATRPPDHVQTCVRQRKYQSGL